MVTPFGAKESGTCGIGGNWAEEAEARAPSVNPLNNDFFMDNPPRAE
ncbi:MAG: hypothetical protein U0798_04940 [Gemmataceae bacterium]